MKKLTALICALLLTAACAAPVAAGSVTYTGDAGKIVFAPGSEYSPTDLFEEFKDVMPGDTLSQPITVKNDASKKVKVKIYMRSLGGHKDSEEFLSQLRLRVEKSADNDAPYMFDAFADQSAQLTDWVCLGTLYSGGEVNLNVMLDVPVEMDNMFKNEIGYLDWEFRIEEYPVEPDDPQPPETGDDGRLWLYTGLLAVSAIGLLVLWLVAKRRKDDEQ